MAYLLDANVFIHANRLHYGFDFCPAFWEWLTHENHARRVFSIEKVGDELAARADELSEWAAERGDTFFLRPDKLMLSSMARVSDWASTAAFTPAAVNEFLQAADYYLVSHALSKDHVVVTHEVPAPTRNKVKIPVACIALGVKCMNPFEMLRAGRARFILEQDRESGLPPAARAPRRTD
jgi:hypothetical protein